MFEQQPATSMSPNILNHNIAERNVTLIFITFKTFSEEKTLLCKKKALSGSSTDFVESEFEQNGVGYSTVNVDFFFRNWTGTASTFIPTINYKV